VSLSISVDLQDIGAELDATAEAIEAAARPAAQAGAQVIYEQARRNAPRSERAHLFYGKASRQAPPGQKKALAFGPYQPGNLQKSIYQAFSKDSTKARAVYDVSWNPRDVPYAYMVEWGTVRAAAHPFMRPAVSAFPRAEQSMRDRFFEELQKSGVTT
jgi:HK97 gp10 family phage protein